MTFFIFDPLIYSCMIHYNYRSDWATLTSLLVVSIAERLLSDDVADYIRFRAVCAPWRKLTMDPHVNDGLCHQFLPRRWIMPEETPSAPYRRRFMNICTGECISMDVPELENHAILETTLGGLLMLCDKSTFVARLFNPLTRHLTELPPLTTLPNLTVAHSTQVDIDLHAPDCVGLADDSTVAIYSKLTGKLAIAKPFGKRWIGIDTSPYKLHSALSFAGRFYLTAKEALMVVEAGDSNQPPHLAVVAELASLPQTYYFHIVDNNGELLLVQKIDNPVIDNIEVLLPIQQTVNLRRKCEAYRVDLGDGRVVPILGLGGRAVFIGVNRTLSVSPEVLSPSLISANTIYLGIFKRIYRVTMGAWELITPVKVVFEAHHLADGITEQFEFKDEDSAEVLPQGIVECLCSYITCSRSLAPSKVIGNA